MAKMTPEEYAEMRRRQHAAVDTVGWALEGREGLKHYQDLRAKLIEELPKLRLLHNNCDDAWYSCPKSSDGCADDREGPECNCGADEHNAIVDRLLELIRPFG